MYVHSFIHSFFLSCLDPSLLSSLASNILTLGFQEHLTPLFRATEEVSRQQLTSAQEELEGMFLVGIRVCTNWIV